MIFQANPKRENVMAAARNFFSFDDDEEDQATSTRLRSSNSGGAAAGASSADAEWEDSNIRGFSFDDDDPFENLNK